MGLRLKLMIVLVVALIFVAVGIRFYGHQASESDRQETDRQVGMMRAWNQEFGWGLSEGELDRAREAAPRGPGGRDAVLVLVPYFPADAENGLTSLDVTAIRLLEAISREQRFADEAFSIDAYMPYLQYDNHLADIRPELAVEPGLYWEEVKFGKAEGAQGTALHMGVLAAAAHYPEWFDRHVSSQEARAKACVALDVSQAGLINGPWRLAWSRDDSAYKVEGFGCGSETKGACYCQDMTLLERTPI